MRLSNGSATPTGGSRSTISPGRVTTVPPHRLPGGNFVSLTSHSRVAIGPILDLTPESAPTQGLTKVSRCRTLVILSFRDVSENYFGRTASRVFVSRPHWKVSGHRGTRCRSWIRSQRRGEEVKKFVERGVSTPRS